MEETTTVPAKPDYSAIYAALAKAQGDFPVIPRDKTVKVTMKSGGTYTFAYAPLDTILAAVRPHLAANGLAVMQTMEADHVWTIVTHSSGVEIQLAPVKVLQTESGPQALGSALTYARRYSVTLALNLAADEDDDANGAQGNKAEKHDRKGQQSTQGPTADPKDAEHLDRIKKALHTLFGADKTAALDKVEALTSFIPKGKTEADRVKGVRDFTKLTGQRLQILTHSLEKLVPKEVELCNECRQPVNAHSDSCPLNTPPE
jgi:hypothetical protein